MALADFILRSLNFISIACAWLRFYAIDPSRLLREAQAMRIVSSWRKIKVTIFMCGLDG
jgi:hypothetical protein